MLRKLKRLFVIKNRFEAAAVTYALSLGAAQRGRLYFAQYPGWGGKLLFVACLAAVFLAADKIFDCLRHERSFRSRELF